MVYRNNDQQIIIELKEELKKISVSYLKEHLTKPVFNIYFLYFGKVYGIVRIDKLLKAFNNNKKNILIQKKFSYITENNSYLAKEILHKKNNNTNEIPVIKDGVLKGVYIKGYNNNCIRVLYSYNQYKSTSFSDKTICMVLSSSNYNDIDICTIEGYFKLYNFDFYTISYSDFIKKEDNINEIILFETETEKNNYYIISRILDLDYYDQRYFSLESFYNKTIEDDGTYITEKYLNNYLKDLASKNINVFNVYFNYDDQIKSFNNRIKEEYSKCQKTISDHILNPEKFLLDLYSKKYLNKIYEIRNYFINNLENISGINYIKDHQSKYLNVENGIRKTTDTNLHPDSFVHLFGPCLCVGIYVEDKNTISSFIQRRINEDNNNMNVINHGSWNGTLATVQMINNTELYEGDSVIMFYIYNSIRDIPNINLTETIEKYNIPIEWVVDSVYHVNHKVNEIYANEIYDAIIPRIVNNKERKLIENNNNIFLDVYFDEFFNDLDVDSFEKIGSIIMNCNPFTYGHRYLIEKAASMVDLLIVFVVSEDLSVFTFNERLAMIVNNTKDLPNVMVVPDGNLILSKTNFPEYFIKKVDQDVDNNIKNSLETFVKEIAPRLNIKYRFVGEEPTDKVTKKYNKIMKELLPKYNIELIEIPRKKTGNKVISASYVRKLLKNNKIKELDNYLPEKTKEIIFDKDITS